MKLASVNLGVGQIIAVGPRQVRTGIHKTPTLEPVEITRLGLVGDEVSDEEHHGGPDQAVYVYTQPDYDWWTAHLGEALEPGTFGENLTIGGLESGALHIGDRLKIGDEVVLEVAAPRIPCAVLAARMNDTGFVKRFRQSGRPGLYCRVIHTGTVRAGDAVVFEATTTPTTTVLETFNLWYEDHTSRATLERMLKAPVALRLRHELETRLAALG